MNRKETNSFELRFHSAVYKSKANIVKLMFITIPNHTA
jgi:hypothetical protein